jgi:hypothetical protein
LSENLNFGGLPLKNTRDNLSPDKRFCTFVYAEPKFGKTTMAATLDKLTQKHLGKPSLIVACETSDGSGTDSITDLGVDYIQPSNMQELLTIISQLATDTKYGGVVIDPFNEVARRFLIDYSVNNLPAKMSTPARMKFGVPVPDDYQNAGELLRQIVNNFVRLSSMPNIECRKHVVGTAIVKYKTDWKSGDLIKVCPDLPGGMAETVNAIFQTIGTLRRRREKGGMVYEFITSSNEATFGKWILGDRYGIPPVVEADFCTIYEKYWLPKIKNGKDNS